MDSALAYEPHLVEREVYYQHHCEWLHYISYSESTIFRIVCIYLLFKLHLIYAHVHHNIPNITKHEHSLSHFQTEVFELHVPVQISDGQKHVEQ